MKSINNNLKLAALIFSVILLGFISSCKDDNPLLPDNVSAFASTELGMTDTETELEIKIQLTRVTDKDIPLTVSYVATGITYGTDFTTTPAATANTVSVTVPKGSSETSFTVSKANGLLLDGDEKITFTISSVTSPVLVGEQQNLILTFSEILSQGATIDIAGGGATYLNQVFIDLSANRQVALSRLSWDLGFYMGDDFRVIVNSTTAMMARALTKNNLTEVTAQDTVGFRNQMSISAFNPDAVAWIDDPAGDLTKTAIASISSTASENKVYIINRGNGLGTPPAARGWKKVRIIRSNTGYTLQHADIAATTFSEIQITKDDNYLFKRIQFENGVVAGEPAKDKWDISWTYFTNTTSFGSSLIPYGYQDLIVQNRYKIQTAKVLTSAVTYANFSESNIASLTFSTSQIGIGPDWRLTPQSGTPSVYTDRFYVIKDADGNYFKLKFNALLKDGVRGTPQFEYALVKKGN